MVFNGFSFYGGHACDLFISPRMCEQSARIASDDLIWRAQLERQQEAVRNQGRIGYIGYEGPFSR
jgi:hypothetical protein